MKNFVAVILPKSEQIESDYDSVVTQEDLMEFEYAVERSTEFKNCYAPFLKSYVEWFFYKGKKQKPAIDHIIGFVPEKEACRTVFKNLTPVFTVRAQEYRRKIEGRYPKFYLPGSFIKGSEYFESVYNGVIISSTETPEFELKGKKPVGRLKKIINDIDYTEFLFEKLSSDPDNLVVVCTKA